MSPRRGDLWSYRIDGEGEWTTRQFTDSADAQDVAEWAACHAWDDEAPTSTLVEVGHPDGNTSRWRVEPEHRVEWCAAEHRGPWPRERCLCGCVASSHERSGVGRCRVCDARSAPTTGVRCTEFRR